MKKTELTPQEKYDFGYASGYRIGFINASRRSTIRELKCHGKPSRSLLHKINREVDCRILREIIGRIADKSLTIENLEIIYDEIVPPKDEFCEDIDWED